MGASAPSPGGLVVDGSPIPLGSTATHEPTPIAVRCGRGGSPLDATNKHKQMRMSI